MKIAKIKMKKTIKQKLTSEAAQEILHKRLPSFQPNETNFKQYLNGRVLFYLESLHTNTLLFWCILMAFERKIYVNVNTHIYVKKSKIGPNLLNVHSWQFLFIFTILALHILVVYLDF